MENPELLDPTPTEELEPNSTSTDSTSHTPEPATPPPTSTESSDPTESRPPPVPKEFAKEPTAAGPRAHGTPDPEPQSKSSKETLSGEVMGFQAEFVIQEALNEINKCNSLHQLSSRSAALVGEGLKMLHQSTAGAFVNVA